MNLSTRILISLGLGLAAGVGFSLAQDPFFPSLPGWIEPIGTLWVNAIRMTVIPLLMGLLVTAIAGQDNAGIAAVTIFLALSLFLRSWRLGLVSLIPNVLPLSVTGCALVLLDHPLQVASAIAFLARSFLSFSLASISELAMTQFL